jgi:hypothetical protein
MIDPQKLADDLFARLQEDGVGVAYAQVAAVRFARELQKDHPDWFKPETVDLADFVEARLGSGVYKGRGMEAIEEILDHLRLNRRDHEKYPRDDVDKGYYAQSYRDLYAIAKMWSYHPDFKKIPLAVPFVQA